MQNHYTKAYIEKITGMSFQNFLHAITEHGYLTEQDFKHLVNSTLEEKIIQNLLIQMAQAQNPMDSVLNLIEPAAPEDMGEQTEEETSEKPDPKQIIEKYTYFDDFGSDTSSNHFFTPENAIIENLRLFEKPTFEDHSIESLRESIGELITNSHLESDNTEISYESGFNFVQSINSAGILFIPAPAPVNVFVNSAPQASSDIFFTSSNTPLTGNLITDNGYGADTDLDGGALHALAGIYVTDEGGSITIDANGDFTYTPLGGYSGADSLTYILTDAHGAQDTTDVLISVSSGDTSTLIDFTTATITGYGGSSQNKSNIHFVEDDGDTIQIAGNTWKDITLNYTITADTVLEFDFKSTSRGEIHGIGFDTNESISANYTFALYGTQNWGINAHKNYAGNEGDWVHYTINVGDFYTGSFSRLFFVNDHDSGASANSFFRNIIIHEPGTTASETMTGSSSSQTLNGMGGDDVIYGYDGNDVIYGGSGIDFLFGGNGADTFAFSDIADIDHIHDFSLAEGDMIDLSDVLVGYDPITDAINDFIMITAQGSDTIISVDADGGGDHYTQTAIMYGISGLSDAETLETDGTLITV